MPSNILFKLENATIAASDQCVFQQITLAIAEGEKVALVGPSGAGKSTLLNELYAQQANAIAYCPQADLLVDVLSAYHNIYMGQLERHNFFYNLWNLIRPIPRHYADVSVIASQLGIGDKLRLPVERLSGGQQQRVAIGRALYRHLPIFFGDEPVSSLDPIQSEKVLTHLLQTHNTAIVAMHDIELALALFDRVIGLASGHVLFDQPANEVSQQNLQALYEY